MQALSTGNCDERACTAVASLLLSEPGNGSSRKRGREGEDRAEAAKSGKQRSSRNAALARFREPPFMANGFVRGVGWRIAHDALENPDCCSSLCLERSCSGRGSAILYNQLASVTVRCWKDDVLTSPTAQFDIPGD